MSKMGDRLAAPAAGPAKPLAAKPSRLAASGVFGKRGDYAEMPQPFGLVYIELPGSYKLSEIESRVLIDMKVIGIELDQAINVLAINNHRSALVLAHIVRDAENHDEPFGTVEEWTKLDIDMLVACDLVYGDVRARLDPIGSAPLTRDQMHEICSAIEKKNQTSLLSYGVAALSSFLLSMESALGISPTPRSSSGPSLPEKNDPGSDAEPSPS